VSGALSGVTQYVSSWMTGDLIGEIVQESAQCAEPFQKNGFLLNLSLKKSSYLISSHIRGLKVQICFQEFPAQYKTDFRIHMTLLPGPLYSSLEEKHPEQMAAIQAEAWADTLFELAAIQDARLVRQELGAKY
jgi:hypothetical protein